MVGLARAVGDRSRTLAHLADVETTHGAGQGVATQPLRSMIEWRGMLPTPDAPRFSFAPAAPPSMERASRLPRIHL
ncbi:hypothetical protein GCM10022402_35910 [Salinactinospora qingdaonensis]|uniref:Uncharacterized protein n=1 Tax=Salinactinospora qingdaonensis TaxID=702744 RepID=A0ABP7G3G4_9ACTN